MRARIWPLNGLFVPKVSSPYLLVKGGEQDEKASLDFDDRFLDVYAARGPSGAEHRLGSVSQL